MEPPIKTSESALASPRRGPRIGFRFFLAGIFLLAIVISSMLLASSHNNLTWLTPADLTPVNHSGPLTELKYQIKRLVMPVWQRFRPAPGFVEIAGNILPVSTSAALDDNLGEPNTTGPNGMRAWILSASRWNAFDDQLKTKLDGTFTQPVVGAQDGMPTVLSSSQKFETRRLLGTNETRELLAALVFLTPKIISGSVRVTFGAAYTRTTVGPNPLVVTNWSANCRVVVPNTGALVIDGGTTTNLTNAHYWLVISPTIFDAHGKPLKP